MYITKSCILINKIHFKGFSQASTSLAVRTESAADVSREGSNFLTESFLDAAVDNYEHASSVHYGNLVADENVRNVDMLVDDCPSSKLTLDDEHARQNRSPLSNSVKMSQVIDIQLPNRITESIEKLVRGIGSFEDYYPFQIENTDDENGTPPASPEEHVEEEEEELCSSHDEDSGSSEFESEAENDDEVPVKDKNHNFLNKTMFVESQLTVRDVIVLITAFSLDATLDDCK